MIERVALCWASPGQVNARFMDSVMRLVYADRNAVKDGTQDEYKIVGNFQLESGPRMSHARNAMCRTFRDSKEYADVEWLLMLDADMTFDENLLVHLFAGMRNEAGSVTRPVTGGLCFGGGHGSIAPTMYRMVDPNLNHGSPLGIVSEWEDGELVQVDATGAACLLIHRGIIEGLAEIYEEPCPWFAESVYGTLDFGEDWTFCMRLGMNGIPLYVATAAKVGHMKLIDMNEAMWRTGKSGLKSNAPSSMVPAESKLVLPENFPPTMNREQRRRAERQRA